MKTILIGILLGFLAAYSAPSQPMLAEEPDGGSNLESAIQQIGEEKPDYWICILIATALCSGALIVIYVNWKANNGQCCGPNHKLILERSQYDGIWVPIATNVTQVCTNKLKVFEDQMTGGAGYLYRVIDAGVVQWSPYKAAWVP